MTIICRVGNEPVPASGLWAVIEATCKRRRNGDIQSHKFKHFSSTRSLCPLVSAWAVQIQSIKNRKSPSMRPVSRALDSWTSKSKHGTLRIYYAVDLLPHPLTFTRSSSSSSSFFLSFFFFSASFFPLFFLSFFLCGAAAKHLGECAEKI